MVLKAMTEFSGTNMNANPSYIKKATYFSNNQTFLVNGYTFGLFNDILHLLEVKLNFTTLLYKRMKKDWGFIYPQENGSYIGTGMVGDIFFKRADLIVAPLGILVKRALYIDYLPPLQKYFAGLYAPSLEASESMEFILLISPFTINVWIVIGITSIIIAAIKCILFSYYDSMHIVEICSAIWTSFIAFFGGKPTSKCIDSKQTYRMVIFTSLLSGTIIWIAYRSYLASELSVTRKVYPFTDMESFSKTSWRYSFV